jgi:fatty-acyl-CoA synthase
LGSLKTLSDVANHNRQRYAARVAFSFEGHQLTFAEFDHRTNQIGNCLLHLGLRPGERVAYLGKNTHYFFELLFGSSKAGIVTVPINWRLATAEILHILRDSGARLLVVSGEYAEMAQLLREQTNSLKDVVLAERSNTPKRSTWDDFGRTLPASAPAVAVRAEDCIIQLYTSGTTGHPKGAMLSHRAWLSSRLLTSEKSPPWNRWTATDVALVAMPNFHVSGAGQGIKAFVNGARAVIAREFDATRVLEYIEKERISQLFLVPSAIRIVLNQPRVKDVDFSCLRNLVYGGSPISPELLRDAIKIFKCSFVQMYGMTEACGSVTALPPEDHDPGGNRRMESVGRALEGVEIVVRNKKMRTVERGEVGELLVRCDSLMNGYWNQANATEQAIDQAGWLHTGDAGFMDKDGYVYLKDRIRDMIISGGENVYPVEVEQAISDHPDVEDVAVIAVPSEKWGEEVKAVVVLRPGALASADAIIAHARGKIAAYKTPKSVDFVRALPRNAAGKVLRRILREGYWPRQV